MSVEHGPLKARPTATTTPSEDTRIADIIRIVPRRRTVLEIGARDGRVTKRLAEVFERVTALDLEAPPIDIRNVVPVRGNVSELDYPDDSFDVVVCTEVLEHLPGDALPRACRELVRVARHEVLVGVPYRQDLRLARSVCLSCGSLNPPWSHLSSFDERRIETLFEPLTPVYTSYVGVKTRRTNGVAVALMDRAGNPWGTYDQVEPCATCGEALLRPPRQHLAKRALARIALDVSRAHSRLSRPVPAWIHMVFAKP